MNWRWLRRRHWRQIDWNLFWFRVGMSSLGLLALMLGWWIGEGFPQ